MKLVSYLEHKMKDDAVIELLDHYSMEVVYEFDRLHEGTADSHSCRVPSAGFELRFNMQARSLLWSR